MSIIVVGELFFEQIEVTHDYGKDIVEVMRDATCQLTDGLHLLRLSELFVREHSLGNICCGANPVFGAEPLILEQPGLHDGEPY